MWFCKDQIQCDLCRSHAGITRDIHALIVSRYRIGHYTFFPGKCLFSFGVSQRPPAEGGALTWSRPSASPGALLGSYSVTTIRDSMESGGGVWGWPLEGGAGQLHSRSGRGWGAWAGGI